MDLVVANTAILKMLSTVCVMAAGRKAYRDHALRVLCRRLPSDMANKVASFIGEGSSNVFGDNLFEAACREASVKEFNELWWLTTGSYYMHRDTILFRDVTWGCDTLLLGKDRFLSQSHSHLLGQSYGLSSSIVHTALSYDVLRSWTAFADGVEPEPGVLMATCIMVRATTADLVAFKRPDPGQLLPFELVSSNKTTKETNALVRTCKVKQAVLFALKACLFECILTNAIAQVHAAETERDSLPTRVLGLTGRLIDNVVLMSQLIYAGLSAVIAGVSDVSGLVGEDLRTILELVALVFSFWAVYRLIGVALSCAKRISGVLFTKYVLKKADCRNETKYLAKKLTEHGIMHEILVEGKLFNIPDCTVHGENEVLRRDEMALPGSTLFPSKVRNVGAILVRTEGTGVSVVGCFFRHGKYLITARHVADSVAAGVADAFIAGLVVKKRDMSYLDIEGMVAVDSDFFSEEYNVVEESVDIFARELDTRQWGKVKVGLASTKKRSSYKQVISAVGFMGAEGLFMTSSGKTLEGSGPEELWHTATTHPGFSGGPIYAGSSVIGMHISAAGNKNVALRMEFIDWVLPEREESAHALVEYTGEDYKFRGKSHKRVQLFAGRGAALISSDGEVYLDMTDDELREVVDKYYSGNPAYTQIEDFLEPGSSSLSRTSQKRLDRVVGARKVNVFYEDECAAPLTTVPEDTDRPISCVDNVEEFTRRSAVHCAKPGKDTPEVAEYFAEKATTLDKLGYEKDKFSYPELTPESELISLRKHFDLYHDRVEACVKPPTVLEHKRVVLVMASMMEHNRFVPSMDYNTKDGIERVIHSTAFKSEKSAGQPHQGNGLSTNGDLLRNFGVGGLVELVQNEWDNDDVDVKLFLKNEAHKRRKVEAGLLRVIAGMPSEKMIKNNLVLGELADSLVENWKKSPVIYGFKEQRPGDIAHLAALFEGRSVSDSDKHNWDWNLMCWLFDMIRDVVKTLAVQPGEADDEWFSKYLADVDGVFNEVKNAKYRCTSGQRFRSLHKAVMKSGWFFTIGGNSIGQLCLHVLAMIRLGHSDEEILSPDFTILAGGDDVLQTFPPKYDVAGYRKELLDMGFDVTEFQTRESFEGCEFFSHVFKKMDGVWTYHPTRFTKHVAQLVRTKLDDLPGALASHMLNHVWHTGRFDFFHRMFMHFREKFPEKFTLNYLKTRNALKYKVLGLEASS